MDNLQLAPLTLCMSKVASGRRHHQHHLHHGTTTYGINGKATPRPRSPTARRRPSTRPRAWRSPIVANQGTIVVICLDAAGNVKAVQGGVQALDVSGQLHPGARDAGDPRHLCPIGYIVLKGGSTLVGTWTFGTNNLSGVTGMTYTFVDLIGMPARPQVS
jgi:hypothetical protein